MCSSYTIIIPSPHPPVSYYKGVFRFTTYLPTFLNHSRVWEWCTERSVRRPIRVSTSVFPGSYFSREPALTVQGNVTTQIFFLKLRNYFILETCSKSNNCMPNAMPPTPIPTTKLLLKKLYTFTKATSTHDCRIINLF